MPHIIVTAGCVCYWFRNKQQDIDGFKENTKRPRQLEFILVFHLENIMWSYFLNGIRNHLTLNYLYFQIVILFSKGNLINSIQESSSKVAWTWHKDLVDLHKSIVTSVLIIILTMM